MGPLFHLISIIRTILVNWFTWVHRHAIAWRITFLISLSVASIKAAVRLYGTLFNFLQRLMDTGNEVGGQIAGHAGIGVPIFDKLNAVLPVAETLAFIVAYNSVLVTCTVYMFLRSAYKAVPLKAT